MNQKPRILFYDLETSPEVGYAWTKYDTNLIAFKERSHIISYAYKWLGDKKVRSVGTVGSDKQLIKNLWKLFDEADIIIGHNSDQFDNKKVNARFAFYGMKPPSPYKTVDTKKVAKAYFNFTSNSLDDLCDYLKIGRKVHTGGFELWLGCMAGNMESMAKMLTYNEHDVELLEKVYNRFLPWITNHPNYGIYLRDEVCPNCGGFKLEHRGEIVTTTSIFQRLQCKNCGAWSRKAKREKSIVTLR